MDRTMPTIKVSEEVKKQLELLMLSEIKKDIEDPKTLVIALVRHKFGYTHSEFIKKIMIKYKKRL